MSTWNISVSTNKKHIASLPNGVANDFATEEECQKYIDENYSKEQIEADGIYVSVWSPVSLGF